MWMDTWRTAGIFPLCSPGSSSIFFCHSQVPSHPQGLGIILVLQKTSISAGYSWLSPWALALYSLRRGEAKCTRLVMREISPRPATIPTQYGFAEGPCWAIEKVTLKPRSGIKGLLSAGGAHGLVCVENTYFGVMWSRDSLHLLGCLHSSSCDFCTILTHFLSRLVITV